jgi:hypothetical protein
MANCVAENHDAEQDGVAIANGPTLVQLVEKERLKERVVTDMFAVALKSLELGQVRDLFLEELQSANSIYSDSDHERSMRKLRTKPRTKLVRVCFYFESAINLAYSIFDISARVTATVLYFTDGIEIESRSFQSQLQTEEIARLDSNLAKFLAEIAPAFDELRNEKEGLSFNLANIIGLLDDDNGTTDSMRKLPLTTGKLTDKVNAAHKLVTNYLRFMDSHLAKKI